MAPKIDTVLETSFVLVNQGLLVDAESRNRFIQSYGSEVSTEPGFAVQIGGPSQPSQVVQESPNLVLPRDRITLEIDSSRFAAKRQYPGQAELERLAEVLAIAFQHSPHVRGRATFGFNIALTYFHGTGLTSSRYLTDRLLQAGLPDRIAYGLDPDSEPLSVSGASISFAYHHDGRRWAPRLEPRSIDVDHAGERIHLALNCHHEDDVLPLGKEPIRAALVDVWAHAHALVEAIDANA